MNIFFYSTVMEEKSGISKKIKSQIESLKKNKNIEKVISSEYKNKNFYIGEKKILTCNEDDSFLKKIFKNLILVPKIENETLKILRQEKIDYIYIRHYLFNNKKLKFLKKIKQNGIKIILEIPTYPYDMEKKGIISKIRLFQEKLIRNKLKKYIDYIVTYSNDDKIYGIKTIKISNGVKMVEINEQNQGLKQPNKIVFTGVAMIDYWHGYDRFIDAVDLFLKNKKNKYEIYFNIVGTGNKKEIENLKEKVKKLRLEKNIIFHGSKFGEELDLIYKTTNIAVGSLGRHRSGVYTMKALKNREYCANGLPMIFSENDIDFINKPFVYKVTPNEEKIKIEEVIEWYEKMNVSSKQINEYSKIFSWDIQMEKIINIIKKDEANE